MLKIRHIFCFFLVMLCAISARAQFYNGHQMSFGKNRVQYNNFFWSYYRFDRFDVYFNQEGNELAKYAASLITPELNRLQSVFDYTIEKRIIFIVYNKLTDFRQGNIGLITGIDEYNTGGVTRIIDNKVFVYFDGDHNSLQKQIRASIAEILTNELLYGTAVRTNMATSAIINVPEWFHKGLMQYISEPWNVEIDDITRTNVLSGYYKQFTRLTGEDAANAGHSFWYFVEKTYGSAVIPMILYMTRLSKSVKSGCNAVLGLDMKMLTQEWLAYFQNRYKQEAYEPTTTAQPLIKKPKKGRIYQHLRLSPDGKYLAYTTHDMGQYRVFIREIESGETKQVLKREHKLEQLQDYSYPVIAWHPSSERLLFIYEANGGIKMGQYNLKTREKTLRNLLYFEKIFDVDFSPEGTKIVMSAYRYGRSDIFVHTLASATNEQITDDFYDDLQPRFSADGKSILFSSNRTSTELVKDGATQHPLAEYRSVFVYDYEKRSPVLKSLADAPYVNQDNPVELGKNLYSFIGDGTGIPNRYVASFDSVIAFVDTAIHYKHIAQTAQVTDYGNRMLSQDVDGNKRAFSVFRKVFKKKGLQNIFAEEFSLKPINNAHLTEYRRDELARHHREDSLARIEAEKLPATLLPDGNLLTPEGDTIYFDREHLNIYRYVFEEEKVEYHKNNYELRDYRPANDSLRQQRNQIRIYQTAFYPNSLVSQVDFSFLEASYQAYTGGAVYYNPGFNLNFKIGASDLFEDYKIIGAARFSVDLESNEFLLSFENLKRRLDKQVIFHRQAYENYSFEEDTYYGYPIKTHTHELFFVLRYPFTQTFAVKGTLSFRDDRTAYKTYNELPLSRTRANERRDWAGLKLEAIFDNTRKLGTNILSGTRYKLFAESYFQVNKFSDLYVLGADFRHYQVIHRNLIWATRAAFSSSFGKSRLLYYLGSVDNWITFLRKAENPIYDRTVRVDNEANYAYQTLATNMRGFIQNIRNGNNFALLNNEIRWPFVQYFAKYPMSNFWSSLQLVGFFDVGSAWQGRSPFEKSSAYDTEIISNKNGGVEVILDTQRKPFVYGYGLGLRMSLFGYFLRFDWARGIENRTILPSIFYFSTSLDF